MVISTRTEIGRRPIAFSRGIEVRLSVDELGYAGSSAFLFGAANGWGLLNHFQVPFWIAVPVAVEVRNQARVHLWFENKFGEPYEALTGTDEALARFVAPAFAVGVRHDF